ncbi:MAG: cytochrome c [Ferruginibacter sp.]|nr:cytochrome c [Ferruginibacter sp.]
MKKLIAFSMVLAILASCSDNKSSDYNTDGNANKAVSTDSPDVKKEDKTAETNPAYDPHRGEGKFTKVELGATLDAAKAEGGKKVYDVKCGACHKLTEEKLVGPGWSGVTSRHSPEWIMNFITNTDEMINKDPKAQAQLEICLVRMPNQNLSDDDARNLLEFMRKNDGVK